MRRFVLLFASLSLVSVFLFTILTSGAFAQTSSNFQPAHPYDSGGGCSYDQQFGPNYAYAIISSCVSTDGSYVHSVESDAYVSFGVQYAYLAMACTIDIYMYDYTAGQYISSASYNCLSYARQSAAGVRFGPIPAVHASCGHYYYTIVNWYETYNSHYYSSGNVWSPSQYVTYCG